MNPSPLFKQQSTFIPQQAPQVAHRGLYYDIFFILGNTALIGMVLAWAGLFGYRFYLDQEISTLQAKLTSSAQEALNSETLKEIEEIKALDARLTSTKPLLDRHTIIEPLFVLIDEMTLTNSVRFSSFKYEIVEGQTFKVTAGGSAASFASLAYQQEVFKKNPSITNVEFSKFSLDEKTGNVSFELLFNVMPDPLLFKNTVEAPTATAATAEEDVGPLPEELLLDEDLVL